MNFTEKQLKQIENKGLTLDEIKSQINLFNKGLPFINLKSAATINHGILIIDDDERENLIQNYNKKRDDISVLKFVPASGAATRMFKFLFHFFEEYKPNKESLNSYINRKKATEMSIFFVGLNKFPFYYKVKQQLHKENKNFGKLSLNEQLLLFVEMIMAKDKFNYGNFPKGLIPFHQYKDHVVTAFEEHLFEAALYASSNGKADLHFTISKNTKINLMKNSKELKKL